MHTNVCSTTQPRDAQRPITICKLLYALRVLGVASLSLLKEKKELKLSFHHFLELLLFFTML